MYQALTIMNVVGGFFRLIRPVNCLMMGFAVIIGAAIAGGYNLGESTPAFIYGFTTGFALTGASMAINDYYDREIDAINEPGRPIPSGAVRPAGALIFAFLLTVVGFAASYLTHRISCLLVATVAWVIFVVYTTVGKRSGLPGNFLVSICVVIPFVYGSVIILNRVEPNVLVFASIAFLSNTGREITKGIADIQGDRTQNVKTLAVRYGEKPAALVAVIFYLSAVALSFLPLVLDSVSLWFVPLVAITDAGLLVSSVMLLKERSRESAKNIKNMVLLWFVFGLLAFVVGSFR